MKYSTEIDTISLQVDCKTMEEQRNINFMIIRTIREYNKIYIKQNSSRNEHEILFNNNRIAIIKIGKNPIYNELKNEFVTNYYVSVCFAGLKRYNLVLDNLSAECLKVTVGILNTCDVDYKLTELDVCIDMDVPMQNILTICTTKLPRTEYYPLNNSFYNGNSVYIEKILENRLTYNSQRAYVYNKSKKEKLIFTLSRFELKLQKSFFLNNDLIDFTTIINALDRYTVMYFIKTIEKDIVIEKYNSYSKVRKRDIDKMGLNRYRVKPDVFKIWNFLKYLKDYRLY